MTYPGKNGLNIRTNESPNGTGPGVRRSKRPLLASHTRCNALRKPPKYGNKVKIGHMSDQLRVSLYMVMSQNVTSHLGEGDYIMFDEIPISTIKLSEGRFQRSVTYPCPRSLDERRAALRIKHS